MIYLIPPLRRRGFFCNKKGHYNPSLRWCSSRNYYPYSVITLYIITALFFFLFFSFLLSVSKFSLGLDEVVIGNPE